jgi:hypothetical protein
MRTVAPILCVALLVAGCGKPVDLKQTLHLSDLVTGYTDAGIVDGRNKIVPTISFRLTKSVDDSLRPLSVNVAFKKLPAKGVHPAPGEPAEEDWDEVFTQSVPFQGNQTAVLTYQSHAGFTGDPPQSRADILTNSHFQDVRVHVFAKHSSSQWTEIGVYDIPRQLLTK